MRLNNEMREEICNRVRRDVLQGRRDELTQDKKNLAEKIHAELVGPYLDTIAQLPDGFVMNRKEFYVKFDSSHKSILSLELPSSKPFPYNYSDRRDLNAYSGDGVETPLSKDAIDAVQSFIKKHDQFIKDENSLRRSTMAILKSVGSIKRLLEVWPESSKYIPPEGKMEKNLPAIVCDDLNKMIKQMREAA